MAFVNTSEDHHLKDLVGQLCWHARLPEAIDPSLVAVWNLFKIHHNAIIGQPQREHGERGHCGFPRPFAAFW